MIDRDDVEDLARLAKLELSEAEKEQFAGELKDVVDYVNKILEIDTEGVKPTYYPQPRENVVREDEVTNEDRRDEMLEEAPEKTEGQFRVPGIGKQD
ncbi:aspartyl/glutamyl-tRNA(Asn/Gln) amidotransferase subunit C [Halarsenatibacter silvermanii]|uniref:Aspartyl/glutamyl-tRNA(Asn/Gln) amidotransferase subunit C n=1 Tax=Halarsenatibacter silvermanii TaxID=321763 RepID=A0A1G9NI89_9FIRM|nr:Asp-tRNA(Asn)/Glu-tRNA(Gln) amidotransferase subunit GatC [Halarsenatibacter silvermanii]SDL85707.1 aspartyl/glutamyl-tRNA(Asn/Gln) amidotransferase subunit C [Halarsenatibacter silvermanii]